MLLASSGQRPGMQLNILQCTGHPTAKKVSEAKPEKPERRQVQCTKPVTVTERALEQGVRFS